MHTVLQVMHKLQQQIKQEICKYSHTYTFLSQAEGTCRTSIPVPHRHKLTYLLWVTSWELLNWLRVIFSLLAPFTPSVPLVTDVLWVAHPSSVGVHRSLGQVVYVVLLFPRVSDVLSPPLTLPHTAAEGNMRTGSVAECCSTLPPSLSLSSELRCSLSLRLSAGTMLTPTISPVCHSSLLLNCMLSHHLFSAVSSLIPLSFSFSLLIYVSLYLLVQPLVVAFSPCCSWSQN